MDTRGWQRERKVEARGPDGRRVPIIAGITRNVKDQWVAAIGADDGATVVLTSKLRRKLSKSMRAALADPNSETTVTSSQDTLGRPVQVATGHTTTERGEHVAVLVVGNVKTTAIITEKVCEHLENNMTAVLTDVNRLKQGGTP